MKLIVFACGSQHDSKGVCMFVLMYVCVDVCVCVHSSMYMFTCELMYMNCHCYICYICSLGCIVEVYIFIFYSYPLVSQGCSVFASLKVPTCFSHSVCRLWLYSLVMNHNNNKKYSQSVPGIMWHL